MEYPKDYPELVRDFSTQESCLEYLASARWPDGFECLRCRAKNSWRTKRYLWICNSCGYQASVLVGTLFQDTKLPLPVWFQMIWWFMGQKSGASALSLQRNFGIGSYRTAWALLQKLRSCMLRRELTQLTGNVEVDEIFVGGVKNKEPIAVAAEVRGLGTGRIRLRHIEGRTTDQIQKFITESITPGSKIVSDRHKSYITIVEKGYSHDPQRKAYYWENLDRDDDRLLPRVHRVASLVKRWYYGTYHGRMDKQSLQQYLDEFVFRFNRRTSGSRGLVFHRLIQAALMPKPDAPA